jgi:hypothetical protein
VDGYAITTASRTGKHVTQQEISDGVGGAYHKARVERIAAHDLEKGRHIAPISRQMDAIPSRKAQAVSSGKLARTRRGSKRVKPPERD